MNTQTSDSIALGLFVLLLYFLPTLLAELRKHHQRWPIFFLNFLLGWTAIGWIIALIWSVSAVRKPA